MQRDNAQCALFFHSVRPEDLRLVGHGVLLGDLADHAAGHAGGEAHRGDIARHDAARADDAAVADGHAGAHDHVRVIPLNLLFILDTPKNQCY